MLLYQILNSYFFTQINKITSHKSIITSVLRHYADKNNIEVITAKVWVQLYEYHFAQSALFTDLKVLIIVNIIFSVLPHIFITTSILICLSFLLFFLITVLSILLPSTLHFSPLNLFKPLSDFIPYFILSWS